MKAYICAMMMFVLLAPAMPALAQPEKAIPIASSKDASPSPDWMPGDPFDRYAEIRCNFIRDVKTGQTYPCSEMPPGPEYAINISVILKPGVQETISVAYLNITAWFAADPANPRFGEYRMRPVNLKEVGKEIPNLSPCTRVYWHITLWDQANRAINSSNSQAAKDLQNYSVRGSCTWPSGSTFRDEMNITQDPYSAKEWYPQPPSEVPPGASMSAGTEVKVRMASVNYVQMPWVILYINQTTYDGKANHSYTTAVRGHCRDQYSPSACDVSNDDLTKANGTAYEFYLPGFWRGTYIEYSMVAVDYTVHDYTNDQEFRMAGAI